MADHLASKQELKEDFLGYVKLYSDGSIERSKICYEIPIHDDGSATWVDHLYNQAHNLYLRVYIPTGKRESQEKKLPVIIYFHTGGFCFGSRKNPNQHNFCLRLCASTSCIVVTPDLRLAPEHRLPAAYEDTYIALSWVKDRIRFVCNDVADFERFFVFGNSSGGNLCHRLAFGLDTGFCELSPIRVLGYILLSPFFGGTVRTTCEKERPCESFWTLDMYDRIWRLALPEGATQDHLYANPFGPISSSLKEIAIEPMLVLVGGNEIMRDRVQDYAKRLKDMGKSVSYIEFDGKEHNFLTTNPVPEDVEAAMNIVKDFICKNSSQNYV